MDGGINLDTTLDYIEFHIFPSQNRYEASVWSSNGEEKLASGQLEQLLLHSPEIKKLSSKDSNSKFKILPPDNINDACWFTTTTVTRFLHVIGLPAILSIGKEISQLQETRKFLISSSDTSEVQQAVDLRLTALKEELIAVLNQTIGSKYSLKDISDLGHFALHFGAKDLGDSLYKSVELSPIEDEDSSEEDQVDAERSRGITRSSNPKRSASPMRRIQIGRSGSRRTAALSIKSLNYFPGREKSMLLRDEGGESSEEETSERPVKNNVLRMSVQDKISLFESKQRDQGVVNIQKTNVTVSANKAVLKRWSSGMGESSQGTAQCPPDETSSPSSPKNVGPDCKTETDDNDLKAESCPEKGASEELGVEVDKLEPEREESYEKHPDSIEWSEQKGAELNGLFMELMESKAVKHQSVISDSSKSKIPKEQKGGFSDHYNKKREEKLQKQAAGKRVEKHAQFEPQKTQKNKTQLINNKTTNPSAVKKSTSKSSPSSATRKSLPLTPSPVKTPTRPTSTNSTPPIRKPNSTASVVQSTAKVENLQPRLKTSKTTQPDANRRIKATNKKQPTVIENRTTTKTKVQTPKEDANLNLTTKPSFYDKVTKKNSVVPLETKPFLRKGSRIGPGVGPVVTKTRVVAPPEETSRIAEGPTQGEDMVVKTIDIMIIDHEKESETPKNLESEVVMVNPAECEESENSNRDSCGDLGLEVSEIEEKLEISPNAWVEIEENHENEIIPFKESPIAIESPNNVFSRPRVRHSLSQMLLEETNESDIGEWGNASHPPTLVYQKDAPRGFKRLLKFARKTKAADSHLTDSSSPEGDDDAEETKATRSFFSLSAFRGNKTNETKILHR